MLTATVTFFIVILLLTTVARKWELKTKHYLPWSIAMAIIGFGLTYGAANAFPNVPSILFGMTAIVIVVVVSIAAIMWVFFRDPERTAPEDAGVIVSPADGTVIYIKEVEDGRFPFAVKNDNTIPLEEFSRENLIPDRGIQIGIAMNYLNVHVNRSPIAGVVKMLLPIHGKFLSLKHIHALLENERTLMIFENDNLKVGIVQIASRLVRRIVPFVEEGQSLAQGQRIGVIKFGSQVDVLIAHRSDIKVQVKVGDEVVAGETVVMTCDPVAPTSTANISAEAAGA